MNKLSHLGVSGLSDACVPRILCLALPTPRFILVTGGGGGISMSIEFRDPLVEDRSCCGLLITVDVNSGACFAGSMFSEDDRS